MLPSPTNPTLVVTDTDRQMATDALVQAWDACQGRFDKTPKPPGCNCDMGKIAGCKVLVESIATAIATARKM